MGLVDIQEGRGDASPEIREVARGLSPISIISIQGYSDVPARDEVKKREIKDSNDPRLEDATAELYKAEFHKGVMKSNCDGYGGLKVSEAKPKVVEAMKADRTLAVMQSSRRGSSASAAPAVTSRFWRTSGS